MKYDVADILKQMDRARIRKVKIRKPRTKRAKFEHTPEAIAWMVEKGILPKGTK